MKRILGVSLLALTLAACGGEAELDDTTSAPTPPAESTDAAAEDTAEAEETVQAYTVEDAMAGSWRTEEEKVRDPYRNPAETLAFFGLNGSETVVEIWPGGGWYSNILAPWLHKNGGQFVAATFDPDGSERAAEIVASYKENYAASPETFGDIQYVVYGSDAPPMGEPESVDAVLTFRNVHNWMSGGHADKFFEEAYRVLKPGGVLGVVEHRLPSSMEQDPSAPSGYVHEDYVKGLADAAGFEFEASSEINANPNDTADHPFGVWTLPPVSRTSDRDGNTPEDFDAEAYAAIGESDRMTLKFVKPAASMDEGTTEE
ncbi:MAG: methyltransferase domain-containing protein [Pseudomonadota bacterium]|nr:methyltransferase domain-containing protein [Pseudomonadota bacterium]